MTIGSVPPSSNHACVRRVTFRNIEFEYPIKSVYVKTNPGSGTGEIKDILYENIKIYFPVWWNIYIGPQQQAQPGGGGTGVNCMVYPFEHCDTQPLIDVQNITVRNLNSTGGFLPPGIIRCNETNTCKDINFEDVNIKGWWEDMGWGWISEWSYGTAVNTYPDPYLGKETEKIWDLYTIENFFGFF